MALHTKEKTGEKCSWPTERNYVLLIGGLSFWAGCALAEWLTPGFWLWVLAGMGAALGIALHKLGGRAGVALALAMLALGALRALPPLHPVTPAPAVYETITGDVYGEPRLRTDSRISFTLTNVTLNGAPQPERAYCSLYYGNQGMPQLFDGASLRFSGRVYLPEGKSGAPRFDFRRWMLQNDMAYGIAISKGVTVENTPETAPVMDWASRLRAKFKDALSHTMGDNAGLAMAMLLGEKDGVAQEEYAAFQRLGVAHVMAVSGLHVGLLGGCVLRLMRGLRMRRGLCLLPLGFFLLLYCGLTGLSAAALRASAMMLTASLAGLWGRKTDQLTTLGAAMLMVLLIDPLQAVSIGFVLSFSAVFGIVVLTPGFHRWLRRRWPDEGRRKSRTLLEYIGARWACLCRWFKRALPVSLAAQLGVLLPTAMYFHSVPLYGVFVNLLVIPYVGILVPVYALTLLLSPVPVLGLWTGTVAGYLSEGLLWAVSLLSSLPYASLRVPAASPLWIAAGMAVTVCLSRVVRAGLWRRLLAVGAICAVAGIAAYGTRPPDTRYIQLAVGQGDAALLFAGNQTVALDVGSDGAAVIDYLMASGRNLDALFLTHLHLDHAGGVSALLEAGVDIRQVYLPISGDRQRLQRESLAVLELLEDNEIPVSYLARGDELSYNGVVVRALWPDGDKTRVMQEANDLPLVLSVTMDGYTMLCASDLTGSYERYAAVPCDVLKVAHHGSDESTLEDLLAFTRPGMALISCSSGSRSLPGKELLARLQARKIPMLRTDEAGDVTLWVENGTLIIAPYR